LQIKQVRNLLFFPIPLRNPNATEPEGFR